MIGEAYLSSEPWLPRPPPRPESFRKRNPEQGAFLDKALRILLEFGAIYNSVHSGDLRDNCTDGNEIFG